MSDKDGNVLGKSQIAGAYLMLIRYAIKQVAISRIVTSAPALFLPGIAMTMLEKSFLKTYPRLSIPMNLLCVSGSLMAALPCAIALFPQTASLAVDEVEPRFKITGVERVYFNKGL